jgi:hypothetical protein
MTIFMIRPRLILLEWLALCKTLCTPLKRRYTYRGYAVLYKDDPHTTLSGACELYARPNSPCKQREFTRSMPQISSVMDIRCTISDIFGHTLECL